MAKKKYRGGQRVFRPIITEGPHAGKPKCITEGCNQPGQHTGNHRKDGSIIYRSLCQGHHQLKYDMDGGYRVYKKDYCENVDGRLGFKCTTTIVHSCQLDVDHVNNDHYNNDIKNLDTLCSCCHNYKTRFFGHYRNLFVIRMVYAKNIKKTQISSILRKNKA